MVTRNKKKGGVKGKLPKASLQKLSNKKLNKLAKQGKLKKRKDKKQLMHLLKDRVTPDQQQHLLGDQQKKTDPEEIPVEEADYDYYARPGRDFSFLSEVEEGDEGKRRKKKKMSKKEDGDDHLETSYKIKTKNLPTQQRETKTLLPIKTPEKGIIQRVVELSSDEDEHQSEDGEANEQTLETPPPSKPLPPISIVQLFAQRKAKLHERRQQIAALSTAILEQPQQNLRKLKELRGFLDEADPDICVSIRKVAAVSLLEVFKDIIPGYRVRVATEKEKDQVAKKDTKELRQFEESLLSNYKNYLEFLEASAKGKPPKSKRRFQRNPELSQTLLPQEAVKDLREVGVRCLCELLVTHPHFNYRTNIIAVVVPLMTHKNKQISDIICNYVKRIFKEDKAGDVTLEVARLIGRLIKSRDFDVPAKVLNTFLALKIKEIDRYGDKLESKLTRKENYRKLSRRDRKRHKQMGALEKELEDAAAEDNKQKKLRLHTEIINMIFLTYFRILKNARDSPLLSTVLEGLARFAHLINLEFFNDLFAVLNELVDSGELTYRESLHCIQTAFIILSGQGAALNIDPLRFYSHLYSTLLQMHAGHSSEDLPIVLDCLDVMFNKRRKQVSPRRITAFLKRLCTLALQMSTHGALGLLALNRSLIHGYPQSDILFDVDSQGSGVFLPELDEPEHCNAENTALYELHLLRKHYHPAVRKYCDHVLVKAPSQGQGSLPAEVARKSPAEIYHEFDTTDMNFNPAVPSKPKKWKKRHGKSEQDYLQTEVKEAVENTLANSESAISPSFDFTVLLRVHVHENGISKDTSTIPHKRKR